MTSLSSEAEILAILHRCVRAPAAARTIISVVQAVQSQLEQNADARLTWQPIPLSTYKDLPPGIASSWVFVLRANCSSGAERHPNSIQRMMSYGGAGEMQLWDGKKWVSHQLTSNPTDSLAQRWISIPMNTWHRPVMAAQDWTVVSFHTASDDDLIEELPQDDEHPDVVGSTSEVYAGRTAR